MIKVKASSSLEQQFGKEKHSVIWPQQAALELTARGSNICHREYSPFVVPRVQACYYGVKNE